MLRKLVLSATTALVITRIASACSCEWAGQFEEYSGKSEVVILGEVTGYGKKLGHGQSLHASMTVRLIRVIKGEISHDSIVLLGDPGNLCREYVNSTRQRIGEQYLIALHGNQREQSFGGCGEAWLHVRAGKAVGHKQNENGEQEYVVDLEELQQRLQ